MCRRSHCSRSRWRRCGRGTWAEPGVVANKGGTHRAECAVVHHARAAHLDLRTELLQAVLALHLRAPTNTATVGRMLGRGPPRGACRAKLAPLPGCPPTAPRLTARLGRSRPRPPRRRGGAGRTCRMVLQASIGMRKTRKPAAAAEAETVFTCSGVGPERVPTSAGSPLVASTVSHSSIIPAPCVGGPGERQQPCVGLKVELRHTCVGCRVAEARERALDQRGTDAAVEAAHAALGVQVLERLDRRHAVPVLEVDRRAHPPVIASCSCEAESRAAYAV
eukprot:scaffold31741_cov66-Phaeocystis_antarctica.AAC.1